MKNFFVVLGGMGTLASESFIHQLNRQTPAQRDQDYCNYILVNHATIPDRTAYLTGDSDQNPCDNLLKDIRQFTPLNPQFFVLTCNTAHYCYNELQQYTHIPILHMPQLTVNALDDVQNIQTVTLMATQGSIASGVYERALTKSDYTYSAPIPSLQSQIDHLIFQNIKQHNYLNLELFQQIINDVYTSSNCDAIILGCTELSYLYHCIQSKLENPPIPIIDAQSVLVNHTLQLHRHLL